MSRDRFRNRGGGFQQRGRGGIGMRGGMGTPNFRNNPQHPFQNRSPQPGGVGYKPNQGNQPNLGTPQKPEASNVPSKPEMKSPPPPPQQQQQQQPPPQQQQQPPPQQQKQQQQQQPPSDAQTKEPAQQQQPQQTQPPSIQKPLVQSPPPKIINTRPELSTPQNQPRKNQQKTPVSGNGQKPSNNEGQSSRTADAAELQVKKNNPGVFCVIFFWLFLLYYCQFFLFSFSFFSSATARNVCGLAKPSFFSMTRFRLQSPTGRVSLLHYCVIKWHVPSL